MSVFFLVYWAYVSAGVSFKQEATTFILVGKKACFPKIILLFTSSSHCEDSLLLPNTELEVRPFHETKSVIPTKFHPLSFLI